MRREERKEGFSLPIVCTAKSKADLMWVMGLWVGFFLGGVFFFHVEPQKISLQWNFSFLHWEGII